MVQNVQDLYSMPLLLQYDPKVISIEDVQQGGFLSGGTQPIAVVERVDKDSGQAVVSATRMPNTPGVSGSGTVFGVIVKAVAPGTAQTFDFASQRQGLAAASPAPGHQRSAPCRVAAVARGPSYAPCNG